MVIFTNPSARAGYDTRSIFKRSLTDLNSEFSFSYTSCLTKAEEPSLPYYLPIAGGRIIGFIPFPRVLVLCEMQSVRFRIWTRVAVSTSCDDNHYTTKKAGWYPTECNEKKNYYLRLFQQGKIRKVTVTPAMKRKHPFKYIGFIYSLWFTACIHFQGIWNFIKLGSPQLHRLIWVLMIENYQNILYKTCSAWGPQFTVSHRKKPCLLFSVIQGKSTMLLL